MANHSSKQKLFGIITITISIIFGLLMAEYILAKYRQSVDNSSKMDKGLIGYNPQLGWSLTADWKGNNSHYDFNVSYSTDKYGFRTQPEIKPSPTGKKIAIIGDSFTFGFGVNDEQTFSAQLAFSDKINEYQNLGVPGYSTDQEFLLMKQQNLKQNIEHYILMFYLGNDILDNALPHPLQAEPAKPFFELKDGELSLKNVPVPKTRKTAELRAQTLDSTIFGTELAQYYSDFDRLASRSEILRWLLPKTAKTDASTINSILDRRIKKQKKLLFKLIKAMKQEAYRQKAKFTVSILPGSSYVNSSDTYSYYFQDYVRESVLQITDRLNIKTIDLASILKQEAIKNNQPFFHSNEGHFTVTGNKVIANLLLEQLN